MILAAGLGARLRPVTQSLPKCMVEIAGKPLLEHTITWMRRYEVEELIINLYHAPEAVMDYFGHGRRWGVNISYSVEPWLLGTAGGVRRVKWFFNESFLVWYGDNLSTCDLARLYAFHRSRNAVASLALSYRDDPTSSGIVSMDGDDRIIRFLEKPRPDQVFSHWVSAGIFVIEPAVLEFIPEGGAPDFGQDVFPALIASGQPLYGYRMSPGEQLWWIDTPEDLHRVQELAMLRERQR